MSFPEFMQSLVRVALATDLRGQRQGLAYNARHLIRRFMNPC